MKKTFFVLLLIPFFSFAQKKAMPLLGLYCSELKNNGRWCFTFDSTQKVTAQLSDRNALTVKEDFLPGGFSDTYTVRGDTIYFSSYMEDYGAKEYPVDYRYNHFQIIIKNQELDLIVEGKTTVGTKREQKLVLKKIK